MILIFQFSLKRAVVGDETKAILISIYFKFQCPVVNLTRVIYDARN